MSICNIFHIHPSCPIVWKCLTCNKQVMREDEQNNNSYFSVITTKEYLSQVSWQYQITGVFKTKNVQSITWSVRCLKQNSQPTLGSFPNSFHLQQNREFKNIVLICFVYNYVTILVHNFTCGFFPSSSGALICAVLFV